MVASITNKEVFRYLSKYLDTDSENVKVVRTIDAYNLQSRITLEGIINLEMINNIRYINKFHETVNNSLLSNRFYCICAETKEERKKRIFSKFPPILNQLFYFIDFIYKRVFPKLPLTKSIYFALTRGYNRVMSKTEILGRLLSCGFEIVATEEIDNLLYIISRKIRDPYYDMNPSYGPIFKMKRIGYKGKIIDVYKFRTMYPFSEYLQKNIFDENKLAESGKIMDDFRITFYGQFFRKYWIDEFPMIINYFKRELKLVGVRPLSEHYFNLYPEDLQKLRIQTKPGLIPPYYADLPVTFEEILKSERTYLNKYFQSPVKTDVIYFFKSVKNIILKGHRSS